VVVLVREVEPVVVDGQRGDADDDAGDDRKRDEIRPRSRSGH
jgi:hypothetical protein